MALNNLWGKLGAFSRNVLVPSNVIYKSFDADPLVSDKMSRAISRWYGMYVDKPEWADDEVKPLGLPRAIAKEFAQVISSEMTITADGGPRADFINEQLTRFQSNVQNSIELCMALGGMAFKPYVSGGNVFIDSTSAASFIPLRFDDGDNCVSGVFKSQPVKVDKSYFVKLEYHDFANGVYTIRNKAFTSDENGITGSEVELGRVPEWTAIPEEVQIKNVEKPLFGYFTPPVSNNIDTASSLGVSIYGGATEDLIRDADEQWARFLYEFESAERKIIGTPEAISGSLPGSKANPLLGDRLFIQMPYDSDDFFKEFSPALRHAGYYEGLQAILRRIEFNTGLAYGDLSPTPRLWKRPRLRSCPRRFASSTQSKLLKIASRLRSKTRSMALTCTPLSTALRPVESMRSISTLTIVFSPIRTPCVNVTARTFATALCRSGSTASNGTTRPKKSQRACAP